MSGAELPPGPAEVVALSAAGTFLLVGLVLGVWKYRVMITSPTGRSRVYVDIAHRAALMYSFAALVMMKLVEYSPYSEPVKVAATATPLFFFACAVASYVYHGARDREQTQFASRNFVTTTGMGLLIAGELGGILVLVWGFFSTTVL